MLTSPVISVIIPNYNYAVYLPERIESILNQTFKKIEIVILDDASSDDSAQIIRSYREIYPEIIRAKFYANNSGSTYQRWNDGAALANGEYILFAGADDSCAPDMLNNLYYGITEDRGYVFAFCNSVKIDSIGRVIKQFRLKCDTFENVSDCITGRFYRSQKCLIPNASGVLFRKSVFDDLNGFNADLKLCADIDLYIRMLQRGSAKYIGKPLNYYRSHSESVTARIRDFYKPYELYKIIRNQKSHHNIPASDLTYAYNSLSRALFKYLARDSRYFGIKNNFEMLRLAFLVDKFFILRPLFYLVQKMLHLNK